MKPINQIKTFFFLLIPSLISTTAFADCTYEKLVTGIELPVGVLLEWSTLSESSNSMFIIEKSEDGLTFINVGAVEGAGDSVGEVSYNFLDINSRSEKNYYRLRQIDFDGTYTFSETLMMKLASPNVYSVVNMSSIITETTFSIVVDALEEGQLNYVLEDWQGNELLSSNSKVINGLNNIEIAMDGYEENIYRLKLEMNNEMESVTFKKEIHHVETAPVANKEN